MNPIVKILLTLVIVAVVFGLLMLILPLSRGLRACVGLVICYVGYRLIRSIWQENNR